MTRRSVTITLHWAVVLLLLAQLKGGSQADGVRIAYAAAGLGLCGVALVKGMMGRPGPKLTGWLRSSYRPAHFGIYILIGWSSIVTAFEVTGLFPPGPSAWTLLLILFAVGVLHSLFHLWRHMALYDNALRAIMPKYLHKVL